MAGYSRQSSAQIVDGATVYASHFNNEYNQIEAAFSSSTGHKHDGTAAEGPQLAPAAMSGLSTNGLAVRTSGSAWASRSLSAPASGMTITNGDGVSGNPSFAFANDLAAVEGLTGTGLAVRTAADTWTNRSVTGTANEITVTDGDGVSGAPTLSLPSALTFTGKTVTGGTFSSPTISSPTLTYSVTTGISAAGSTQGTATALTSDINIVTTVGASQGVVLPTATAGRSVFVVNRGANALAVYPATGAAIDGLATNAAYTIAVNGSMFFDASTTTQWYSNINTVPVAFGGTGSAFFTVAGPTATRTYTFPDANTTMAGLGTTQTFSGVNTYSAATRGSVSALGSVNTNQTLDMATANNFSMTLTGSITLQNPTNLTAGQSGSIVITQDGTGGRTLAYGTNWKFAGGTAPTLSTAASSVDTLTYYVESSSRITASLVKGVA